MRWSLCSHSSHRTQWLLRVRVPAQVHLTTVLLTLCTRHRCYAVAAPLPSATSVPAMPIRPSPPAPGPSHSSKRGPKEKDIGNSLIDQLKGTTVEQSLLYLLLRVHHVRRRRPAWPCPARVRELIQPTPQQLHLLKHTEYVCRFAERLATTSRPEYAEIVMRTAFAFGTTSKMSRLERVAYQLYTAEQWRAILNLVAFAQELHGKLSSRLMDWRVLALVKCNIVVSLHGILNEYTQHGLTPSRRSYHLVLQGCLRNRDLARSRECLEEMAKAGFAVDASTIAVIVTNYGALGLEPNIEDHAVKALATASNREIVAILNGLIKLYLDNGDLQGALKYLRILEDPATFASRDQSGPGGGHILPERVVQKSNQLPEEPSVFGPDLSTYTLLMHYASRSKDISWTTRILGRLKSSGFIPDARVATILIRAFYAHKAPIEALRVMLDLCQGTGRLQLLALFGFRFLRPAHAYHGPFQGKPTIAVCNALFEGVLAVRGIVTFPAIIRLMRTHAVEPNAATMAILLTYLRSKEGISRREAMRVVKLVQSRTSLRPSLRILHNHLNNELRMRKFRMLPTAGKYLIRQVDPFVDPPDRPSWVPSDGLGPAWAVTRLLPRRKRESLGSLIRELEAEGVNSDRSTFSLNLRREAVLRGNILAAQAQLDAMIKRGLRPNSHHYSALMEGLTLQGDVQEAFALLQSANDNGIPSNVVLYTILITGYSRLRRPDMALRTFQQMINEGIEPDAKSVYALVEAYRIVGQWWMARMHLRRLWHMIEPEPSIDVQQASLGALRLRLLSLISPDPPIPPPTGMAEVDRRQYVRYKFFKGLQYWARLFPRRLNIYS